MASGNSSSAIMALVFWKLLCPKSEAFLSILKFSVMIELSFTPLHGRFVEMTLHSLTTSSGIHKRRVMPRKVRLRVRYILFSIEDALGVGSLIFMLGLKGGLHFLCYLERVRPPTPSCDQSLI